MNNESLVSLTPSAMAHVQKWIVKDQAVGLRLSTTKTGCSGLSYETHLVHEVNPADVKVEVETPFPENPRITIFIDSSSLPYLKGICIDFAKPPNAGVLQGAKLVFINPNQTGVCGCGESFSVE